MPHAVARCIVAAFVLAAPAGCAASGAAPSEPGSVTATLHSRTAVTFGSLPQ